MWRVLAWSAALANAALAALFAASAVPMVWAGLLATARTRSPEEYAAAMIFAMLGGLMLLLALVLLTLAFAAWIVGRRLRRHAAGFRTIAFVVLANLCPLALLAYAFWFR